MPPTLQFTPQITIIPRRRWFCSAFKPRREDIHSNSYFFIENHPLQTDRVSQHPPRRTSTSPLHSAARCLILYKRWPMCLGNSSRMAHSSSTDARNVCDCLVFKSHYHGSSTLLWAEEDRRAAYQNETGSTVLNSDLPALAGHVVADPKRDGFALLQDGGLSVCTQIGTSCARLAATRSSLVYYTATSANISNSRPKGVHQDFPSSGNGVPHHGSDRIHHQAE